jgi:hypothetical protein
MRGRAMYGVVGELPRQQEEARLYQARCPSCGAKLRIPHGQPPPRCRHCWSPLVREEETSGMAPPARPGNGLDVLLKGFTPRATTPTRTDGSPEASCPWCGMESDPGLFCSDCGSPLLAGV